MIIVLIRHFSAKQLDLGPCRKGIESSFHAIIDEEDFSFTNGTDKVNKLGIELDREPRELPRGKS